MIENNISVAIDDIFKPTQPLQVARKYDRSPMTLKTRDSIRLECISLYELRREKGLFHMQWPYLGYSHDEIEWYKESCEALTIMHRYIAQINYHLGIGD